MAQQRAALPRAQPRDPRLQQLAHDAEAAAAFQLAPASIPHDRSTGLGSGHRGAQQTRAADPALTVEEHEPAASIARAGESSVDRLPLCLSFHEPGPAVPMDRRHGTWWFTYLGAGIQRVRLASPDADS